MNTTERSFGFVPIHQHPDGPRFLVIQHRAGHWGFPKGHAEPGETPLQTARRELAEETGIRAIALLADTPILEQYICVKRGQPVHKTVTYFLGATDTIDITPQEAEVADFAWLDADATRDRLTFDAARKTLDTALGMLP